MGIAIWRPESCHDFRARGVTFLHPLKLTYVASRLGKLIEWTLGAGSFVRLIDEFIKTVLFTIWLWRHISPRKVPSIAKAKVRDLSKQQSISMGISWSSAITGSYNILIRLNYVFVPSRP